MTKQFFAQILFAVFFLAVSVLPFGASAATVHITNFSIQDPSKVDGSVVIEWEASGVTSNTTVQLDVVCAPEYVSFTTNFGNKPVCAKGGVWTWEGESKGSIVVTPSYTNFSQNVTFKLTIWKDSLTQDSAEVPIVFPAKIGCDGYCPELNTQGAQTNWSQAVSLTQNLTKSTQPGSEIDTQALIELLQNLIILLQNQQKAGR